MTAMDNPALGYRARKVLYPAVLPLCCHSGVPRYIPLIIPMAYGICRPLVSVARLSNESLTAPKRRVSSAWFHLSQSPTVVSRPPGPCTFSNGMLMRHPAAVREYACPRPGTIAVKSSRQRVCTMPAGLKMRSLLKRANGMPLTRSTIVGSSEKPEFVYE